MVRKLQFKEAIDTIDPQSAFSCLFGDGRFVKQYHHEISGDSEAVVTEWDNECTRYVTFSTAIMAPKPILKAIGTDVIKVREKQQYKRCGDCFTVVSEPVVDIPGGEQFCTKAETLISPMEKNNGCVVTVDMYLEFKSNVWGLQGIVETFMESRAKEQFTSWFKLALSFCKEELKQSSDGLTESEIDEYFDAEDKASSDISHEPHLPSGVASHPITLLARLLGGNSEDSEPEITIETWFVKSVLSELNTLQINSESSRNHLEMLNTKLQKVEKEIGEVKTSLQPKNNLGSYCTTLNAFALGITTGVIFASLYFKYRKHA